MSERLALAISIAREAGALQRDRFHEARVVETKSTAIDLVTDVDRACDALLVERIGTGFPEDGILTEESGNAREAANEFRWVIDPLDGTTNYTHGFPHYAVSIGIEEGGSRTVGVIYDPMRDELFHAERGAGAFLNDEPISVSKTGELQQALLATGFAYDVQSGEVRNLAYFERFLRLARGIRRAGSAALDLAYVACGRFDGFWEMHLHAWDVAAGLLLIEEAGGHTSDFDGSPAPDSGARLVAANPELHPRLLEVLR